MKKKIIIAKQIIETLNKNGFQAYFVGGFVRDMVIKNPAGDIDIATDAKPKQIKKLFPNQTRPLGARFGTILLIKQKIPFQISTFRDLRGNYSPDLAQDLNARDFTINALAYNPTKKEIIDLTGSRADIRKKRITTINPLVKFRQDPLRMIRAVRFSATLGFEIDQRVLQTIKKSAASIKRVSAERLREELILIFTSPKPYLGLGLLDQTGLLKYVLPQVYRLKGVKQPEAFHPEGDVFVHTQLMFKKLKNPSLVLAFSCLLHDIGKPKTYQLLDRIRFNRHDVVGAEMAREILTKLRFPKNRLEAIVCCVGNHMRIMEAPKMRESTLKRLLARPTFKDELKLHYIDCLASHGDLKIWRFLNRRYKRFQKDPVIPRALLDGRELIKMGFTPGPIFGTIHKRMQDLQLEGRLRNKTQARAWVVKTFKEQNDKTRIKKRRHSS